MNDAQQEMSPDFVLMRLVSAAEYDRLEEPEDLMSVKAALGHLGGGYDVDASGPPTSPGLGSASPHYSSPLPGRGEPDGGLVVTEAPLSSEETLSSPPEDFSVAAQRFVDYPVQHGQLMVFKNLLRSGDQILEEAERQRLDSGSGTGPGSGPGGVKDQNSYCTPSAEENLQPQLLQWHPVLRLSKGSDGTLQQDVPALDSESVLVTDRLAKWPPGLLDQAVRLGLLEETRKKNYSTGEEDLVLALARRLGQLGEGREGGGGGGGEMVVPVSRCSCHNLLASGTGGEDPSETSDALLVLEGLGSEEVGGDTGGVSERGTSGGTLSGLMLQVHRLAEEAGVCTDQTCRSSPPCVDPRPPTSSPTPCPYPYPLDPLPSSSTQRPKHQHQSRSQPQSRAATPKLGVASGGGGRGSSPPVVLEEKTTTRRKKGGSLKVRLSKLFRTKSSSGGSGGPLDKKRPSVSSSTSSGGSLLDVWAEPDRLQLSRPISAFRAFTDDPPQQHGGSFMGRLHPPTSNSSHPPLSTLQHSLSLNDSFLRGLPRPVPLRPGAPPPPRLAPRCPLSRPDAGSFATSLRELEKCGWYWGPMNWEDAEMKLKEKPDGSFLVRDSSDPRYILSLSFRSQGVTHHTRMEHYRGTFSLWCHPKFEDRCHSVVEFIERAIMHSKNGKFLYFLRSRVPGLPPTPVQLLYPVSRFSSVKTLQHLCRFCIRQLVRIDHIQELPLPTPLISYLRKFYYYDPEEEISPSLKERGPEPRRRPVQQGVQPVQQGVQPVPQVHQGVQPVPQVQPVQQGVLPVQPVQQEFQPVQQGVQPVPQVQPVQQGVLPVQPVPQGQPGILSQT
ncbi:suppressor of cytokine signaling 7-like isoform X2 [Cebidichthys violaceus]|uniref:suppressor of cytokine signaling 7-like isoform X2 n=1 Tax=Cebidichthys violaceus TaxID=271503 RepID=UPI0035CA02FF